MTLHVFATPARNLTNYYQNIRRNKLRNLASLRLSDFLASQE